MSEKQSGVEALGLLDSQRPRSSPLEQEKACQSSYNGPSEEQQKRVGGALTCLLGVCVTVLIVFVVVWDPPVTTKSGPGHDCSGVVFLQSDEILLLREGKSNSGLWILPGQARGCCHRRPSTSDVSVSFKDDEESDSSPLFPIGGEVFYRTEQGGTVEEHHVLVSDVVDIDTSFILESMSSVMDYRWVEPGKVAELEDLSPAIEALFTQKAAREELSLTIELLRETREGSLSNLDRKIKKLGAGLFLRAEGDILLLRRNSSHNNATLSVPGGNVDLDDPHLRMTAEREAVEEMGSCPNYTYRGEIDTRRGKHKQKVFKMYLGDLSTDLRYDFHPILSPESLEWGWYPLKDLHKRDDLHPTIEILVKDHAEKVEKIFGV